MKVVRKHTTAFSRTCHEVVRIERLTNDKLVNLLNSKIEYNQRCSVPRLGFHHTQSVEANMSESGHGVSGGGSEGDTGAGQARQDSSRAGSDGGPGDRGGGDQSGLQPRKKKRKLDDNDDDGGDNAAVTHNRKQSRERCSGIRKYYKPKRRQQTDS